LKIALFHSLGSKSFYYRTSRD